MTPHYSTTVEVVGGRNGTARSTDGVLDLRLAVPKEMGGQGGAPNPEQLFAAGYAACFGNAVIHITRTREARVRDEDITVAATVGIGQDEAGGFTLSVALAVTIAGVDQATADAIVAEAHTVCPYSNATRGNVAVEFTVAVR